MPSAKTPPNVLVNRVSRVSEHKLQGCDAVGEVHEQVTGGLGGPRPGRARLDPSQHHGVHGHDVHRQEGFGLGSEELAPGRARPTRCGIDTGIVQDLPYGGGGGVMAEPDKFALHAPVSPAGMLGGHANDQLRDPRGGRKTSGLAAGGVVPSPRETSLGCQARIVAGVTGKTSTQRRRGSSQDKAASHTRSAGA